MLILLRHISLAVAVAALSVASTAVPYPTVGTDLTTEYVAARTQPAIVVAANDPTNTPNTGVSEYLSVPVANSDVR